MTTCPLCGSRAERSTALNGGQPRLWRCGDCGVVHWGGSHEPPAPAEYYRDYYSRKRPDYDSITERRYHALLERLEAMTCRGRLLDVGCGTGHLLAVAAARGWEPVGVEVSASAIQLLSQITAERPGQFRVLDGDLLTIDLGERGFRVVTMFEVLEHLAAPAACLRKVFSVLEPGGLLYLTTPNFDSIPRYLLGGHWRAITPDHLCLFNPRTLRVALERAGFRVVSLVTKNVDIPEILAKRRRPPADRAVSTFGATREFRRAIERSAVLRWLKVGANTALGLSGLGETIEALAIRAPA